MMEEIKIMAEIQPDPTRCRFTVDRPVYEGTVYFRNREQAKGSPLAEAIFAVGDQISAVLISGNVITVTKEDWGDWVPVARQIGAAIRQVIRSGAPPVSEEVAARRVASEEIRRKVQQLLDTYINPAVAMHGGFVELIDVIENNVFLRMGGGCQGCGAANLTLRMGIEQVIREHIPEVGEIFDTTDHAAGQNPYYSPSGW